VNAPHLSGATVRTLAATVLLMLAAPSASALELLVPAYFYPEGQGATDWQTLASSAPEVRITAILNPHNGPGDAPDPLYSDVVDAFRAAGGRVIGYVYTGYGKRDIGVVRAEIDTFYSRYGIDGIFIDEMSSRASDLGYYTALHDYIGAVHAGSHIVGNPGTQVPEAYLSVADVLVTFESPAAEYAGYVADDWTAIHDAARFAHLVYDVADADAMQATVDSALRHGVGALYVTDDRGANPWDRLPSYWAAETARVAAVPEPSAWAGFAAGLGLLAARLRRLAHRGA
jgi:hypothetical protein